MFTFNWALYLQEGDEHESWEDCSYRIFVDPDAVTDILQQELTNHCDNNNSGQDGGITKTGDS